MTNSYPSDPAHLTSVYYAPVWCAASYEQELVSKLLRGGCRAAAVEPCAHVSRDAARISGRGNG